VLQAEGLQLQSPGQRPGYKHGEKVSRSFRSENGP
jgi:hypothetical protein